MTRFPSELFPSADETAVYRSIKNAAGYVKGFKNSYLISKLCKVAGTGKTGRAGADYGNFNSVTFGLFKLIVNMSHVVVRRKTLKTSDTYAFRLLFRVRTCFRTGFPEDIHVRKLPGVSLLF